MAHTQDHPEAADKATAEDFDASAPDPSTPDPEATPEATRPAPDRERPETPELPETIEISAFGQQLCVTAPRLAFLRSDSQWRLRHIYQPALSTHTLASSGVALDIGAGFGAFALPFALAFPDWTVFCLEPDPVSYACLLRNVSDRRLANVIALPCAAGFSTADTPQDPDCVALALADLAQGGGATETLTDALPRASFSRSRRNAGYLERGANPSDEYECLDVPTLAASFLVALQPRLLKLVAPLQEKEILADLASAELDHLIGESWSHVPSALVHAPNRGLRQTWIPRAGHPALSLRRSSGQSGKVARLDVVLATGTADGIGAEVARAILAHPEPDLRLLVVEDARNAAIPQDWPDDPRLIRLRTLKSGRAAAWNLGRMHSTATHIAFVDTEGLPDPDFFPALLDLARHTGAEVVQGGYSPEREDDPGLPQPQDQAEADAIQHAPRHDLAGRTCHLMPPGYLMTRATSVWRRVHRRDFLDSRNIWFPEHLEVLAERFFQFLTLRDLKDVPTLDRATSARRQGPDPQRNTRQHFHLLDLYRLLLKRGLREGWISFAPFLNAFAQAINGTAARLPILLRAEFTRGAAELWVHAHKALGPAPFQDFPLAVFGPLDFAHYFSHYSEKLKDCEASACWAYLDTSQAHVPKAD